MEISDHSKYLGKFGVYLPTHKYSMKTLTSLIVEFKTKKQLLRSMKIRIYFVDALNVNHHLPLMSRIKYKIQHVCI